MPGIVIFLDLDDTILQTAPKCRPGAPLEPAATDRAGNVLSFMTRAQSRLLAHWRSQGTVIPVTGRTDDALARVLIEFDSWRITHHGAIVRRPDGRPPGRWHQEMEPRLIAAQPALREIGERLRSGAAAGGYRVSAHAVGGQLTYLSAKADDDGAALEALRARLTASGLAPELALHHNGNNLALTVAGAQKHDAVRLVMAELAEAGPIVTIGAGDSLTDLGFMRLCDFALTPKASQIQRETWSRYPP
ncbi:MAG: hypothetical protein JNM60_02070 [Candidatus Competibacteraceae bacterium]|nr:hypothetical protein [Candidatus Competibacteraceae bacterium]